MIYLGLSYLRPEVERPDSVPRSEELLRVELLSLLRVGVLDELTELLLVLELVCTVPLLLELDDSEDLTVPLLLDEVEDDTPRFMSALLFRVCAGAEFTLFVRVVELLLLTWLGLEERLSCDCRVTGVDLDSLLRVDC